MGRAVWPQRFWRGRAEAHEERVRPWVEPRLQRRMHGRKHPVDDFLFEYYGFSPAKLARWHPGWGVALEGPAPHLEHAPGFTMRPDTAVEVDPQVRDRLADRAARTLALLEATQGRQPVTGCFALHEWAMVYRSPAEDVRHAAWPLRLPAEEIAATVEGQGLRCTHFDAYRFFTTEARPRNPLALTRSSQIDTEQPGCLHATMDLYKWAYRLAPALGAELIADCFALARASRELDMRAAPYDLSALGVRPIPVETPDGRREYARAQRDLMALGLRQRQVLAGAIRAVWS